MPYGRPAKRRRLASPVDDTNASETILSNELFHRAADWDLEQDYETRSRQKKAKESNKLPIKNIDGKVERIAPETQDDSEIESDSFLGSEDESSNNETPPTDDTEMAPILPLKIQLLQAQEEIARLAGQINEDPEENAAAFKKLAHVASEKSHPNIQKLVLVSQAAVYKDAAPGYRIRAYKDEDLGSKISKEVRRTRQYEQSLVTSYQTYIRHLKELCKFQEHGQLKVVALNCVCSLLLAIPHFNFRTELLQILIHELSRKETSVYFHKSLETMQNFFDQDEDGGPALEAVTLLTKMMKAKDYNVREEVLDAFFHLRLLSELSAKGSTSRSDSVEDLRKLHGRRAKKDKWEHRSKKERKLAKDRQLVEKDMKEADAAVDFESREKLQSETLKIVFLSYFRILKARIPHLTGAVLEGLAKFGHLINQDFFGDLLEALKDIINQAEAAEDDDADDLPRREWTRERLLASQTAFTLLSQQDAAKSASALQLDLSFFSAHVYRSMHAASVDPDIQLGPKSLRLPDPDVVQQNQKDYKVNVSTPVLLLTRVLTAILLKPSSPPTTQTVATFYKRLLTMLLQLPEKSAKAVLVLMSGILTKHGRKVEALWYSDERKGDGVFRGEADSIEATNVFAVGSGVWEQELLRHHYCPEVSVQARALDKVISGLAK